MLHSINTAEPKNQSPLPQTEVAFWPEASETQEQPFFPAESILALDLDTGKTLISKNSDAKLYIASLTKVMTALIILEEEDLDRVVTVPSIVSRINGSRMWLAAGERITIDHLLQGLLMNSANEAAFTLGIVNAGSTENFVAKMNKKAQDLGLENTHFANPAGFDDPQNYSSAADLSIITRRALKNDKFRKIISTRKKTIISRSGIQHHLLSTNLFLHQYNKNLTISGVKTGTTAEAGENLITLAKNSEQHEILTIVLDASKRYTETRNLITWVFEKFSWK